MTKHQIALVQASYSRIVVGKVRLGTEVYYRSFDLDPGLEAYFVGIDIVAHATKLMAALSFVVSGLSQPETILPALHTLGAQHARLNLEAAQFGTVGRALLMTLADEFADIWSPELCAAWGAAYQVISAAIMAGANQMRPQAAA